MILLAFALASPAIDLAKRRYAFQDCMETYAQSLLFARKSPAGIAADALRSCEKERQKLRIELARERPQVEHSSSTEVPLSDASESEDRAAVVRVISIVTRFR
jgi:hypothetical protein